MLLDNYAVAYAGEVPVAVPMYDLDMMASKMPMRSTHGSLDPFKAGPRVYQPARLQLYRQRPLLWLPLQR